MMVQRQRFSSSSLLLIIVACSSHIFCQSQLPWFAIADHTSNDRQQQGPDPPPSKQQQTRRDPIVEPNFVILFMDDLGYGDMGFTGHPTTKTPNIDYLAFNGKVLTSWYSGCAACTGSRAALMTGRQWTRTGLPWVLNAASQIGLPLNETTIAEQLKKKKKKTKTEKIKRKTDEKESKDSNQQDKSRSSATKETETNNKKNNNSDVNNNNTDNTTTNNNNNNNSSYATAIVGKWHLGQRPIYLPGNRGFDYYLGIPYSDDMGNAMTTSCENSDDNNNDNSSNLNNNRNKNDDKTTTTTTIAGSNPYADGTSSSAFLDPDFNINYSNDAAAGKQQQQNDLNDIDPGAIHLPLIYQEYNQTHVLEQPLDFTTLSQKYNEFTKNFITMHQDQPFLLYVPFSHVHVTSKSQPELQYAGCDFKNTTTRGSFGDALAEADDLVGTIVETLQDLHLLENTLIMFTSDNGPWLSRGLSAGSEGLFTGRYSGYYDTGKATTWEGGIRMPAFAYWLGQIEPYSRSAEVVSSLDVFPTISRLAGIPLPIHEEDENDEAAAATSNENTIIYDGKDMTDILLSGSNDAKSKHDFLFFYGTCHIYEPYYTVTAVRHGPYKAHWCTAPGLFGGSNITQIKVYRELPLLFQVEHDPSEAFPLAKGDEWPTDPAHRDAMERIVKAYAMELSTFAFGTAVPYPDGPGEGPGLYGVCCDRSRRCNCTKAKSDGSNGLKEEGVGILNIGTKRHHVRYHFVLGEEEPSPPRTKAQRMLQNVV